jgi:hypothetical protein
MRGFAARFLAMMQSAPASLDRDRGFRAVMVGSSALGAGCLIASLPMVQSGPSGIDFRWNYWAIPAFALGAVMAVGFWQLIFRLAVQRGDEAASRRKLYAASAGSPYLLHHHNDRLNKVGVMRCSPLGIVASIAGTLNFNLIAAFKIQGSSCGFSSAWITWLNIEQLGAWHNVPVGTRANGFDG